MPSKCNRNESGSIAWAALGISIFFHGLLFAGVYWVWRSLPRTAGQGPGIVTMDLGDFDPGSPGGSSKPTVPPVGKKIEKKSVPASPQISGVGSGRGSGTGEGNGGSGGGAGSGMGGGGGGDGLLAGYIRQVLTRIERNKQYPKLSQENGEEGIVLVDLRIGRSGQLLGYDFRKGEAHPRLVAATKNSIEAAAPFPPLPEQYAQESLSLQVPVRYQLH